MSISASALLPDRFRTPYRDLMERLRTRSIETAVREQSLADVFAVLERLVPDIRNQYSGFELNTPYLRTNVRAMHAFQMSLVERALELLGSRTHPITVVDVGDSAGTHLAYLRGLHPELPLKCLSVNLDGAAVRRIREAGAEAVQAPADRVAESAIAADLLFCFEVLEHVSDPVAVLSSLARRPQCAALVLTVPYLRASRVGLHHIRHNGSRRVTPENTHIFELAPDDWSLLIRHAGWAVHFERTYLQYPKHGLLRWLAGYWRRTDFEGFWGAVLTPDPRWADLYERW